ncbi:MAG: RDD family protein [Planctomycetota bacterium]|nr:RDD family protein [Planctomycetota bacterium]
MSITFTCSCGEKIQVPSGAAGRKAFCLRCRKSVPIPDGARTEGGEAAAAASSTNIENRATAPRAGAETPAGTPPPPAEKPADKAAEKEEAPPGAGHGGQYELVHEADGKQYWKLTCVCGKHVRSPAAVDQPYGRCPKCGRLLKMPGYVVSRGAVLISARPGEGPVSAPSRKHKDGEETADLPRVVQAGESGAVAVLVERTGPRDESETVTAPAVVEPPRFSHEAVATAADRLRPQHTTSAKESDVAGRVSAWPLAGKAERLLAAFIDVTFAMAIAGVLVVLGRRGVLPPILLVKEMVVVILVAAGVLNDGLVQLVWGGSLGKKLVVLVVQTAGGREPGGWRIMLRGLLKWLLIPGWIIGAVDPSQRTLHDLLCNTLVLKGRHRHK